MKLFKLLFIFALAVVTTYLLMSLVGTQLVLADVGSFGLEVSFADRVSASLHDMLGLLPILLALVSVALAVAFSLANRCIRWFAGSGVFWYSFAGLCSMPAALLLIKYFMGITIFAAARSSLGMFLVSLCGLAGGWVFAQLMHKRKV